MEALETKPQRMAGQVVPVLFLLDSNQAVSRDREAKLRQQGELLRHADIDLPPEADSIGLRLRSCYGKLQGKGDGATRPGPRKCTVELYALNPR